MSSLSLEQFLLGNPLAAAGGQQDAGLAESQVPSEARQPSESWIPEIRHLSATSIGMFRRCPEQFRQRYLLGRKERPGEGLVVGSFFHGAMEFNMEQKILSHVDRPLSEVVEFMQDTVVPKVVEENGGESEIKWDSDLDATRRDAERVVLAYGEQVFPRIQPISCEEKFEMDFGGAVPLIGYIDLTDSVEVQMDTTSVWTPSRVIDTKTGKQAATKLKPSWELQATIYGAAKKIPVEYHTISRAKVPKIVTGLESEGLVKRVDEEQAANVLRVAKTVADLIKHMYDTIGPGETWPTLGAFPDWSMSTLPCNFCGYRKECPAVIDA